jgi:hypothetical protein
MARLKKQLRNSCILVIILLASACVFDHGSADAAFATKFSFTAGELYTDNIFFVKDKESDWVTTLTPTFSFLYAPTGMNIPALTLNISPSGAIFARHSDLNNFGDNWNLNGGYTFEYSPRLSFYTSDVLSREGRYRLGPLTQGAFQLPDVPTSPPPVGTPLPGQGQQNLSNFNSGGSQIANNYHFGATYLYRPDVSYSATYDNNYVRYLDLGGSDLYQVFGVRGVYNWRKDHNLHAGYSLAIYSPRDGKTSVINNFDIGDDYFSDFAIQLTPTLSLSASTGISFNTSNNGPTVANNSTVTLIKVWERAQASASVHHGLTPSYGVGTISETTTFNGQFHMQLTEKLTGIAGVDFPLYDTDNGTFKTLSASAGLQYQWNAWLVSTLFYNYRMSDTSSAAARNSNGLLQAGKVSANSGYVTLTAYFDVWPNPGLSRSLTSPTLAPLVRTPFPNVSAPPSSNPSGTPSSTPGSTPSSAPSAQP